MHELLPILVNAETPEEAQRIAEKWLDTESGIGTHEAAHDWWNFAEYWSELPNGFIVTLKQFDELKDKLSFCEHDPEGIDLSRDGKPNFVILVDVHC